MLDEVVEIVSLGINGGIVTGGGGWIPIDATIIYTCIYIHVCMYVIYISKIIHKLI